MVVNISNSFSQNIVVFDDVNAKDQNGDSALHRAVKASDEEAVAQILQNEKVDVNVRNNKGETPIQWAVRACDRRIVKILLKHKEINLKGQQLFYNAVRFEDEEMVKLLLNDERVYEFDSALNEAAELTNTSILKLLLKHEKANVAENRRRVIQNAVFSRSTASLELLLVQPNIEINVADINGDTPLHRAIIHQYYMNAQLLLKTDRVDVNRCNRSGNTPLHLAANVVVKHDDESEYMEMIGLLFERKVDFYRQNNEGNTFLHVLVKYSTPERLDYILSLLKLAHESIFTTGNKASFIQKTYDTSIKFPDYLDILPILNKGNYFQSPHLKKRKFEEISRGLNLPNNLKLVSLLNQQNDQGDTLLHIAVKGNYINRMQVLLKYSEIDPNLINEEKKTPRMIAKEKGFNIIETMIDARLEQDRQEVSDGSKERKRT